MSDNGIEPQLAFGDELDHILPPSTVGKRAKEDKIAQNDVVDLEGLEGASVQTIQYDSPARHDRSQGSRECFGGAGAVDGHMNAMT